MYLSKHVDDTGFPSVTSLTMLSGVLDRAVSPISSTCRAINEKPASPLPIISMEMIIRVTIQSARICCPEKYFDVVDSMSSESLGSLMMLFSHSN